MNLILSQTRNFKLFQTERVCRQQFYVRGKMAESFSKRVENTMGKGEIARNKQFLLFQQKTYRSTADM